MIRAEMKDGKMNAEVANIKEGDVLKEFQAISNVVKRSMIEAYGWDEDEASALLVGVCAQAVYKGVTGARDERVTCYRVKE